MLHLTRSHFDTKILADQTKERCGEIHFAVGINWHVHSNEFFIRKSIWTFVAESQRWIHVFEHVVHLAVVDLACGVGVVFSPYPNELVEMMSAQDRRVPGEVVKIVHNYSNEQIQHKKRTEENKRYKIRVGEVRTASFRWRLLHFWIALSSLHTRQHYIWPRFTGGAPIVKEN